MPSLVRPAMLFLLLAGCFDSKRIIFRNEEDVPDAAAAGGASALPSRATGAAGATAVEEDASEGEASGDGARAAVPGSLEATTLGAEGSPIDAGTATGDVDAGAADPAR